MSVANMNKNAEEMIIVMERLNNVMDKENRLLDNEQYEKNSMSQILKEKTRLTHNYEHYFKMLSQDNLISLLPKDIQSKIKTLGIQMKELIQDNELKLTINMASSNYIIDAIAKTTQKFSKVIENYNLKGEMKHVGNIHSLSVNKEA